MNNEKIYMDFIRNVLFKTSILTIGGARKILYNSFEELDGDKKATDKILIDMQEKGYLLITENSFIISKGLYERITSDKFFDGVDKKAALAVPTEMTVYTRDNDGKRIVGGSTTIPDYLKEDKFRRELLACMWYVIKKMPVSKDFVIGSLPWNILYEDDTFSETVDGEEVPITKIIEVAYIPESAENSRVEMIKACGKVPEEMRLGIRRIAIIENENHAFKIPYYGFTEILTVDDTVPNHLRIVEKRAPSDAWKGCPKGE